MLQLRAYRHCAVLHRAELCHTLPCRAAPTCEPLDGPSEDVARHHQAQREAVVRHEALPVLLVGQQHLMQVTRRPGRQRTTHTTKEHHGIGIEGGCTGPAAPMLP